MRGAIDQMKGTVDAYGVAQWRELRRLRAELSKAIIEGDNTGRK